MKETLFSVSVCAAGVFSDYKIRFRHCSLFRVACKQRSADVTIISLRNGNNHQMIRAFLLASYLYAHHAHHLAHISSIFGQQLKVFAPQETISITEYSKCLFSWTSYIK
jgi:hypothetical protein